MALPALKTEEDKKLYPILIVDKIGVLGQSLAFSLSKDFLVVLASRSKPDEKSNKIIHIPFKRRIPQIPDNKYKKIFIVDDGDTVTRESVESFIIKAREDDAPLYFIGSIRNPDIENSEDITSSYSKAKILIFGDLFDRNIFFDKNISMNRFIIEARKNKKINVEGNGLILSYPMSFLDTVKLIVKASYLEIPQKTILLFYPHPITDISLANTFKKIDPDIKVDFISAGEDKKIYIPKDAQHAIGKYNLEEKIKELDLASDENRQLKIISKFQSERKIIFAPVLLTLLLLSFLILLPLFTTSAYLYFAQKELMGAVSKAEEGDIEEAQKKANNAKSLFAVSEKTLTPLIFEAQIIGRENEVSYLKNKAEGGKKISDAAIDLLKGAELFKEVLRGVSTDPKNDFVKSINLIRNSISLVMAAEAENQIPKELFPKINNLKPFIDLVSNSSLALPEIMGFEKEMNYLILFYDNTNFMPSGGKIEAYTQVKIRNGKISPLKLEDAQVIDNLIKSENIVPPFFIRRYISESLSFQNSGSSPDFSLSAKQSSSIFNLAKNQKVDAVIGFNYEFLKNIANGLDGENSLSESKVYGKALKENAPISVLSSVLDLVKTGKDISYLKLSEMVGKSITEKHLIFAFSDLSLESLFSANGWSGSIWDQRKEERGTVNDYLGIIESSIRANRVNADISRSISKKVSISGSGEVTTEIIISYKNNSSKQGVGGEYKNYLQILAPNGSLLQSVSIDGKKTETIEAITNPSLYETRNFNPPKELEVDEEKINSKTSFGLLLSIESGKSKTVNLSLKLPNKITPSQKEINYSLKIFKQAGMVSFPFELSFDLSNKFSIVRKAKNLNMVITKDEEADFIISQK